MACQRASKGPECAEVVNQLCLNGINCDRLFQKPELYQVDAAKSGASERDLQHSQSNGHSGVSTASVTGG